MAALVIFAVSFFLRILFGYLFLGSIDLISCAEISQRTLTQEFNCYGAVGNYFPLLMMFYWFGVLFMTKTGLPLALCYKLLPIFFDSLIAVLIYEIVKKSKKALILKPTYAKVSAGRQVQDDKSRVMFHKNNNYSLSIGLLYACSPLSILVNGIHFHWESLFLFFLLFAFYVRDFYVDSCVKYCSFGVLFCISFLLKPVSLLFSLLFFVPRKNLKQELGDWWHILFWLGVFGAACFGFLYLFFKLNTISFSSFLSQYAIYLFAFFVGVLAFLLFWIYIKKPKLNLRDSFAFYAKYQIASCVGLFVAIVMSFALFVWFGFDLLQRIEWILRYMNQGVQIFGLPFAYPFDRGIINVFLRNRFWLMTGLGVIAFFYYKNRLDAFSAIALTYALIIGFSGIGCQYLLWLSPFLFIGSWWRLNVLYTATASLFIILYDVHPFANPAVPYQCVSSFIPLKSFAWLSPSVFFTQDFFLFCIKILGNYLIPLICLSIVVYAFYGMLYKNKSFFILSVAARGEERSVPNYGEDVRLEGRTMFNPLRNGYCLIIWLFAGLSLATSRIFNGTISLTSFQQAAAEKLSAYASVQICGRYAPMYGAFLVTDIIFIFFMAIFAWTIYALRLKPIKELEPS